MGTKVEGIWIGEKDLTADEAFIASAQEEMNPPSIVDTIADSDGVEDVAANRRDFLKIMGFSISAATVASCNIPVKRAMPYVVKPDAIVPGVATYYASSFVDGGDYCPILVKTRDGRPIKVEGNVLSDITKGGTSARTQGMVLGLYDVNRLKRPTIDDEQVEWSALDAQAKQIFQNSKGIRLVTRTILSPTAKKAVGEFVAKYPQTQITTYDPVSSAAILTANETDFGDRVIPDYHFDKAEIIVGFDADFLGTWISPIEYSNRYIKGRKIKDIKHAKMSKHVQVEAQMSLTGSNADNRILVRPSEQPAAVAYLYQVLTGGAGNTPLNEKAQNAIDALARQLLSAKGKSLVVSGSNDVNVQTLVNAINSELGNYGKTITFDHASLQRQGDEKELVKLVADINAGAVDTVVFHGGDPLFEYASLPGLAEAISSVANCISLGYFANQTNAAASIVAPVHHNLECWGDAEPKRGMISLMQPTIAPLFDTRQAEHSLLVWAESPTLDTEAEQPYFEYLKTTWEEERFDSNSGFLSFQSFFDKTLQDGVYKYSVDKPESAFSGNVGQALGRISAPSESDLEIQFTESIAVGNGQFADNPWLQEMPDPVTRCAWGNYLAVPVDFDGVKRFKALNGLEDGDLADLTINGTTYRVPVIQQFGQMPGTVALHMGYGRDMGSMAAQGIGVNVNDAMTMSGDRLHYFATDVSLSRSKG
ncbi:MAG: 4Fe-4S ferredoxin, partial [Bacteroidota bacterium]